MSTNVASRFWHLKDFRLFEGMNEAELESLHNQVGLQPVKKNEFIYFPGDKNDGIYLLREGFVKQGTITEAGDEMIYNIINPGDIFGHFGRRKDPSEYAQAVSDGEVYCLRQADFERLLRSTPDFGMSLVGIISERLKRTERKLSHFVFKDSRSRVLEMLYDLGKEGELTENHIVIDNILTHQEIASLTATSRQTVSAILSDLKFKGIINYDRKKIFLPCDLSELK